MSQGQQSNQSSPNKSKQFSIKTHLPGGRVTPYDAGEISTQRRLHTSEVEQGQKIRQQFRTGARKLKQLGKVIIPENTRPGSRHLLLRLIAARSAEAGHGFKCGNLRGRGRTCSGWSEGDQPGVMGLEPTEKKKSQPIARKIFPSQKRLLYFPRDGWKTPSLSHLETHFTKRYRGIPGGMVWPLTEENSRPSEPFPVPTPMIPGSPLFLPSSPPDSLV